MRDFEKMSKKHFDSQAKVYDQSETVYCSKFPKISCHDVADRLRCHNYEKLLDVSCGTGYLIDLLRKEKNVEYCGLDLSTEMLKIAKSKFDNSVNLVEGTADDLPYEDGVFDIVTCVQSFHHYPYPDKAMQEAYRVLKKGGLYVLSDTGCSGIGKYFDNFVFRTFMKSGDYAAYSRKDIEKMMNNNRFMIVESQKVKGFIFTVVGRKV